MSKSVAEFQRPWLSSRGFAVALTVLGVYFALILVPAWRPGVAGSGIFFVYVLSIPFALLGLLSLAIWAPSVPSRRAAVARRSASGIVL